jgi:3-oxoacyl-[acyl-carrier protein] reductase
MRLGDKIAVVTGAGSGFGEAIAKRFAQEGARVSVVDLNGKTAARVASEIGKAAIAITADVGVRGDMERIASDTVRAFGAPGILVNNAGTTHRNQPMLEVDEETFDRVFRVNVKSIYLSAQAFVPLMRDNGGGVILNVSSTAAIRPRPGLVWYAGSKGAVSLFSKAMALELAADRIRVNAICPVMSPTGLIEQFMGMADTPENRQKFLATIPLGRLSRPEDIASGAVYLASDEAEFITGIDFLIDGGRCV